MANMTQSIQISLFDLFDQTLFQSPEVPEVSSKEDTDLSSYLDREERILSLAREKYERTLASYNFSELEEKVYSIRIDDKDNLKTMIGKIARIFRRYIEDFSEEKGEFLRTLIPYDIRIEFADKDASTYFWDLKDELSDRILKLTLSENGYPDFIVYGAMKTTPKGKKSNVLYRNETYSHGADLAKMLACMFVIGNVNMAVINNPNIRAKLMEVYDDMEYVKRSIQRNIKNADEDAPMHLELYPVLQGTPVERILHDLYPDGQFCFTSGQFQRKSVLSNSVPNLVTVRSYEEVVKDMPVAVMMEGLAPYHAFLQSYRKKSGLDYWPVPFYDKCLSALMLCISDALKLVWEERGNEISFIKELTDSRSEYAKSYQTKKNIPEKVLQAMEKSGFNDYFGYVEFDQDVDLQKVEEIRKEFKAFMDTYFSSIDISDNAMRIRRLGNHKASGLYYPGVKCLCIDINSPRSMIHELGHLLDYQLGEKGSLSLEMDFSLILSEYKRRLLGFGEQDSVVQAKLKSTGKYNLNYYLRPTEVFARTFELYCMYSLGVNNSLLNPAGFAYPDDEAFLALVERYFKKIFKHLV